ncbi:MAG: flavin reductase family protein [Clostridia bacterium]|nr:flavin reductase family protein [Clostridia bacterium]
MEKVTINDAQKITSPNPFTLVATRGNDGKVNVMALSWWTYVSNHPATVVICTSDRGYTGGVIKETGEFTLSMPDESLREQAFLCGTCSGRDRDKAAEFGIEFEDSETVSVPRVKGSALALECRLKDSVTLGDHTMYIAEVTAVFADRERNPVFAAEGYRKLRAFEAKE